MSVRRLFKTKRSAFMISKKNQELEKFKFVLDYKIKELKRQIEPRENEIADMAQQIKEMDQELEKYHKSNAALDLMIGELKLKMEGMQQEIDVQKATLGWRGSDCAHHVRSRGYDWLQEEPQDVEEVGDQAVPVHSDDLAMNNGSGSGEVCAV